MTNTSEQHGTAHTCGQCGTSFGTMAELQTHLADCETYCCGVCGFVADEYAAWLAHRPCPDAAPAPDPEGEWRAAERQWRHEEQWDRDHPEGAY